MTGNSGTGEPLSDDPAARALARNVRALREARGLTQAQLAQASGVPRATCAHLETGASNPTLRILLAIAKALRVSVEELLTPQRTGAQHYPAESLPRTRRGLVLVRKLLPQPIKGFEFDRLDLPPGAQMGGVPHTPGTREFLCCESGEIELGVSGETFRLKAGDVVAFPGDQKHGYRNPGAGPSVGYSVVVWLLPETEHPL